MSGLLQNYLIHTLTKTQVSNGIVSMVNFRQIIATYFLPLALLSLQAHASNVFSFTTRDSNDGRIEIPKEISEKVGFAYFGNPFSHGIHGFYFTFLHSAPAALKKYNLYIGDDYESKTLTVFKNTEVQGSGKRPQPNFLKCLRERDQFKEFMKIYMLKFKFPELCNKIIFLINYFQFNSFHPLIDFENKLFELGTMNVMCCIHKDDTVILRIRPTTGLKVTYLIILLSKEDIEQLDAVAAFRKLPQLKFSSMDSMSLDSDDDDWQEEPLQDLAGSPLLNELRQRVNTNLDNS